MSQETGFLITLPPSTACETGRWILDHYKVAFNEERHTPFFLFNAIKKAGGTNQYPLYKTSQVALFIWQAAFKYFEAFAPAEQKLLPQNADEAARLQKQSDSFHTIFATQSSKWAYYYLLPYRKLSVAALAYKAPWYETFLMNLFYPLVRIIMTKKLETGPKIAQEAGDKMRAAYDELDNMLIDGRPYLNGDRYSLFDVVVCANGGPTVMPPEYGAPLPTLEQMPEDLRKQVEEFRERPTGQYMLRVFKEKRKPLK